MKNTLEPKPKGRAKGKAKAAATKPAAKRKGKAAQKDEPAEVLAEEPEQAFPASQSLHAELGDEPEACDGEGTPMDEIDGMDTPRKRLFHEEGEQVDAAKMRELKATMAPKPTRDSEEWIQFLTWKSQGQPKAQAKPKAAPKEKAAAKAKAKTAPKAKVKNVSKKPDSPSKSLAVKNSPSLKKEQAKRRRGKAAAPLAPPGPAELKDEDMQAFFLQHLLAVQDVSSFQAVKSYCLDRVGKLFSNAVLNAYWNRPAAGTKYILDAKKPEVGYFSYRGGWSFNSRVVASFTSASLLDTRQRVFGVHV